MLKCFILEAKPLPVCVVSEHGNLGHFPSKYSFRFFCGYTKPELVRGNGKFLRWYAVHYTAFETFWALWVSFSFFREFFILQGVKGRGANNETEATFELLLHAIDYQNFMLSTRNSNNKNSISKRGWYRANGDLESDIKSNFIMHIKF